MVVGLCLPVFPSIAIIVPESYLYALPVDFIGKFLNPGKCWPVGIVWSSEDVGIFYPSIRKVLGIYYSL